MRAFKLSLEHVDNALLKDGYAVSIDTLHLLLSLILFPAPRSVRPAACPNAGFMAALLDLDERLHGACSINPEDGTLCKRGKPAARTCPICGDIVGVSSGSLNVHMRARHRTSEANNAASVQ